MTDFKTLLDVMKSQFIMNFKTGNMIFDMLITTFVVSTLSLILDKRNIHIIYDYLFCLYNKSFRKSSIILESTINIRLNKLIIPNNLLAIIHYIKVNRNNLHVSELSTIDYNNEILYIPKDKYIFEIFKNIYCIVYHCKDDSRIENGFLASTPLQTNLKYYIFKLYTTSDNINYIHKFIDDVTNDYIKYIETSNNIQKYYKFKNMDCDGTIIYNVTSYQSNKTFNTVFFHKKNEFIKSLDFFLNNSEWFVNKQCPHHLGILLHGEPGTGKTSFIKSLITYTNRSVVYINLNKIKTCDELENMFMKPSFNTFKKINHSDYIYVFEDIDCLSNIVIDRKLKNDFNDDDDKLEKIHNLLKKGDKNDNYDDEGEKLNLSFILNLLDGIIEMPGRIIVMTTNYPDRIDPALIRPGRIDFNIEMKKASRYTIKSIIEHYYDIELSSNDVNKIKDYIYTPAEISDIVKSFYFKNLSYTECIEHIINK